jgi:DNA repair protein RadC
LPSADLRQLLDAERAVVLRGAHGLGEATYVQLQAALELTRRYLLCRISRGQALASPEEVRQFLQLKMRGLPHEVFACLFLDNQHTVISYEESVPRHDRRRQRVPARDREALRWR